MPGHILIVTIGSRGDMQPCVALAKGLQEASYEVCVLISFINLKVVIAGPPNHRDFVSSYGVPFEPIGIDTNEVVKEFAKGTYETYWTVFNSFRSYYSADERNVGKVLC